MFRQIGAPEIILILVVLLLLFGAKRLPDLTRSVGRSMRIFKSEVKEMRDEDERTSSRVDDGTPTGTSTEPQARELEGRVVDPHDERTGSPERVREAHRHDA
jgi:sec-independent protein translocase protein TatA